MLDLNSDSEVWRTAPLGRRGPEEGEDKEPKAGLKWPE